jgi:hypothetical protein
MSLHSSIVSLNGSIASLLGSRKSLYDTAESHMLMDADPDPDFAVPERDLQHWSF